LPTANSLRIPEVGQIVELRRRRYAVLQVSTASTSTYGLADGHHIVTGTSIDDDALGEEVQVVWEVEPGTRVIERLTLPSPADGFDDPERLDAFLDAVRWGAASQADTRTLQAPFRSGIEIEDYQLDPLVRALQMPRVNLLIADDVGLGKTIESGLVCQELILRHRVRRVLIVCPSCIQVQWKEQMWDKFGLDFRIVDSTLMKELRRERGLHVNPWSHFPRLITSIDFIKRERPLRLLQDTLPADGQPTYPRKWDLMIVDEAHNVAPARAGKYATDSLRTIAIRTIAPHVEHKLFLTATPHNGYPESFSALLELLDNQRFAQGVKPDRDQLGAIMVRRLKSELKGWDGAPRFAERKLYPLEVEYSADERRAHQLLSTYGASRLKRAEGDAEKYACEFVLKLLKKRLISSPAAFARTLDHHRETVRNRRRPIAKPTIGILRRRVDQIDEDFDDDDAYETAELDMVDLAGSALSTTEKDEQAILDELSAWSKKVEHVADSKTRVLIEWLNANLKPDGKWSDRRVIIFTEYRATQKWLHGILATAGLTEGSNEDNRRLLQLFGGMPVDLREKVKAAFQASPTLSAVRILLATDAASEGIDLQNHCSHLIQYEIPWNPNKMEQRNGRVDRHGQRESEVNVFHFVSAGYEQRLKNATMVSPGSLEADLEFLMRAAVKVEAIREDLGKVGPVIASQVEEAMLGKRRTLDTAGAERQAEPVKQMLKFEYRVKEKIAEFEAQLRETREEMGFTPENIKSVVDVGLQLAGKPALVLLPTHPAGRSGQGVYHLPRLDGSWAVCVDGLAHPHTREIRPITFDHAIADGRDDVVLVHLGHRLVQMCLRLLRAEIWASETAYGDHLYRVSARLVRPGTIDTPAIIAYGRLVILGGDGHRLHEEVITGGGLIKEGRFERMNVTEVKNALAHVLPNPAPDSIRTRLTELWPAHERQVHSALDARSRDRLNALQKTLADRSAKEANNLAEVLRELAESIRQSIERPEFNQLELDLFSNTEREQWDRNRRGLEARVARIPEEIERETAAIRARFADPQGRLFPVAVMYLVPERLVRQ
jgi:superfamily II DNA or RNA helicase